MKINKFSFVKVAVSVIILVVLLGMNDMGEMFASLKAVDGMWVLLIIIGLVPCVLLRAYRWKILYGNDADTMSLKDSVMLSLVGLALNLVLPATSGDVAKSYFGYKWTGAKEKMVSVALVDKILSLVAIMFFGIPFAFISGYYALGVAVATLFIMSLLVYALAPKLRSSRFFRWIAAGPLAPIQNKINLGRVVREASFSRGLLVYTFVLALVSWVFNYAVLYLCFRAVGNPVPLMLVFSLAPLLTLVRLFPLTLNGLGTDEVAFVFLFSTAGIPGVGPNEALACGLVYRLLAMVLPGLIGFVIILKVKKISVAASPHRKGD